MRYRLCEAKSAEELEAQVNALLREGWRLSGSVSVTESKQSGTWWFYQAMVHPSAKPEARGDWESA